MMKFWLFIVLVMVLLGHDGPVICEGSLVQWSYCSTDRSRYSLDDVNFVFSPDRIIAGQTITVNGSASLHRTILEATLHATMTFNGLNVLDERVALCNSTILTPSDCPLKEGPLALFYNGTLPSDVPSGAYRSRLSILDEKGTEFGCLKMNFVIDA